MKSPSFHPVGFVLVMVLPGIISAQQPTAYIPNSPVSGAETAICTPPLGSTCSVPSQTSSTTTPHFSPTWPASLRLSPSQASAIPALFSSLQSSWSQQATYTSLASALYVAAPTDAQFSLAVLGWNWEHIVQSEWYVGNASAGIVGVGEQWKEVVRGQENVLQRGFDGLVGLVYNGTASSGVASTGYGGWEGVVIYGLMVAGWIAVIWVFHEYTSSPAVTQPHDDTLAQVLLHSPD
ncbi:hypothetical protein NA56DRAFT_663599 [Hyaloscypha hepaticicola]|uniref:Uncharacterized protein n=1 Tax=Hyaloscypha hepaticicola TaxID=2082293 RepID=A0A2J6PPA9_9HELO|nr:hypothetical protein NA56DRAFT_663599 [Hyaloscypha hepaticicola]